SFLYELARSLSIPYFSCDEAITSCLQPIAPRVHTRTVLRRTAKISVAAACLIGVPRTTPVTTLSQPVDLMRLRAHEDSTKRPPRPDPAWMSPAPMLLAGTRLGANLEVARTP